MSAREDMVLLSVGSFMSGTGLVTESV